MLLANTMVTLDTELGASRVYLFNSEDRNLLNLSRTTLADGRMDSS